MTSEFMVYVADGQEIEIDRCNTPVTDIPDISVFISCFNERDSVIDTAESNLEAARQAGLRIELIFVDDASQDDSVESIRLWMQKQPADCALVLVARTTNAGLGANFRLAATIASGRSFRLSCGDNPEPIEALVAVFKARKPNTIILPYHQEVEGKSKKRRQLSHAYTMFINLLAGHSFRYYNGQPLVPRRMLIEHMPVSRGFGFQAELVSRLAMSGCPVQELPVFTIQRGTSTALSKRNMLSVMHVSILLLCLRVAESYHKLRKMRSRNRTISAHAAGISDRTPIKSDLDEAL